jgi:hypothetical protein
LLTAFTQWAVVDWGVANRLSAVVEKRGDAVSGSWERHGVLPQKQITNTNEKSLKSIKCRAARDGDQLDLNSMFSLTVFSRSKAMVVATVSKASFWAQVKAE